MKFIYCLVLMALVGLTFAQAEKIDDLRAISKVCEEEAHCSGDDIRKFYKNGMKPEDASEPVKCHIKCMMEKRGLLKDGVFEDIAFVEDIKHLPILKDHVAEITKAASECKEEKGDNDCETAYKIIVCFKTKKEAAGVPNMVNGM